MSYRNLFTQTLLAALCAAALAEAHSAGTTQVAAGVPNEGNCTSCHTLSATGTGNVMLAFPATGTYQPGVSQHLKLTITDPAAKRWGFMLTARLQSNTQLQGGSFTPGSDSQLFCTQIGSITFSQGTTCPAQQPLSYLEQTYDGTKINTNLSGSVSYEFDWLPPSDANTGNIIFYISALASNNDGGTAGDITYLNRYIITPQSVATVPIISSVVNVSGLQASLTPGSLVLIRGTSLTSSTRPIADTELVNNQYPQVGDGVSVTIGGVPAYIKSLSPTQISVIVPQTAAVGNVNVQVTNGSSVSSNYSIDLEAVAPALFLLSGSNKYVKAAHADCSAVAPFGYFNDQPSSPAKPGEEITLTAVGLGVTNPAIATGIVTPAAPVATLVETPVVIFGQTAVRADSAILIPGLVGVYTVSVQVPTDAPDGDVPVQIQVSGVQSDTGFYLPVKR